MKNWTSASLSRKMMERPAMMACSATGLMCVMPAVALYTTMMHARFAILTAARAMKT
jgi:hypothetical protein